MMPARSQSCGKFFSEGFESSVACGNSARAENCEPHREASYPRAARAFASVRAVGLGAGRLTGL